MRAILTLTTILSLTLVPMALVAKPNGNGNGNNGNGNGNNGNGNGHTQGYDQGHEHFCPPGLARRDPPCVPPGQARQGVTTEDWIGPMTTLYHPGDYLELGDFVYLTDFDRYGLPPLDDGQQYAVIDGTLVALDSESYQILQLLRAFAAVGN